MSAPEVPLGPCVLTFRDQIGEDTGPWTRTGRVVGEVEAYGFMTPGGGWALYGSPGWMPSYRVLFVHKGKRTPVYLRLDGFIEARAAKP